MTEIESWHHSRTMEISNQTSSVLPQSPLIEQSDRRKRRRNRKRILEPFSGTALSLLLYILYYSSKEIGIVHGFPTGAGGCAGDGPAVEGSHLFKNKTIEDGDLALGGIVVTIGGTELDPNVRDTDFPLNQDLEIVADSTFAVQYRGILIRMQVPDSFKDDTSKVLVPSSPLLKTESTCISPIVGLTHTNPSNKDTTSGTLNFPSEAVGVIFDITVVFLNNDNSSAYVYSRFITNFRNASSDAPTPSFFSRAPTPEGVITNATSTPTAGGGTPRPTISPKPTLSPTVSISPTTTPFPSPRPTLTQNLTGIPTISALPSLTFAPTMSPENLESDQPSIVPTTILKSKKGKGMMMMGDKKKGKGMMGKKGSKKKGGKGMGMGMSSKGKMGKGGKGMGKKKDKDKKGKDKKDKAKDKDKAKASTDDYYDDNYGDDDGTQARTSNDDDYYDDNTSQYNDDGYTTTDNYLLGPDEYKNQLDPLIKKLPAPVGKKPVKKPISKPVPKPVKKPVPKPVTKPVPKPVTKPVPKPIKKPVPRPMMKPKAVPKPVAPPVKKTYYATSVLKPVTPPTKVTLAPTINLFDKIKNNVFYRVNTVSRGQSRTRTINQRKR